MDFARGLGVLQSWQFLSGKFSLPLAIVTEKLILQKFTRIGRAGSQQRVGFLNLCTADILDWIILCYEDCPKYHQLLSRISGLYLPTPQRDKPKCLQTLPKVPRGTESSRLRTTDWHRGWFSVIMFWGPLPRVPVTFSSSICYYFFVSCSRSYINRGKKSLLLNIKSRNILDFPHCVCYNLRHSHLFTLKKDAFMHDYEMFPFNKQY